VLLDLSEQQWTKRVPTNVRNMVGVGKKIYGWPNEFNVEGQIYNTDTLKKVGVKAPQTWTQVLQYCSKMNAAGISPYTIDLGDGFGGYQILYSLVASTVYAKKPNWDTLRNQNKTTFASTPGWAEAFNKMLEMKSANCFQPGSSGDKVAQSLSQVVSGKAGAWPILSSLTGVFARSFPTTPIAIAPFPAYDKANGIVAGPLTAWAAGKTTKYKKQVFQFLQFATRPSVNRHWAKISNAIATVDLATFKLPANFDDSYKTIIKSGRVYGISGLLWPAGVQDVTLGPGIQALFLGTQTVPGLIAALDTAWTTAAAGN
jgi:raffinose/stachyose/melibiose transport system substrate-binding protein